MKHKYPLHISFQAFSTFAKAMEVTRIRVDELNQVLKSTRKFRLKSNTKFERKIQKFRNRHYLKMALLIRKNREIKY